MFPRFQAFLSMSAPRAYKVIPRVPPRRFFHPTSTQLFAMPASTVTKLNTGAEMPTLGLGTWKSEPGQVEKAVEVALKNGYKHIDTATAYGAHNSLPCAALSSEKLKETRLRSAAASRTPACRASPSS